MKIAILTCLIFSFGVAAEWNIEQPIDQIPDAELKGDVMGHTFELGSASFTETGLELKSKAKYGDFWHTVTINIMGIQQPGYWEVKPSKVSLDTPWVNTSYFIKNAEGPQYSPTNLTLQGDYSMKLLIEKEGENNFVGYIHLSFPDYRKSYVLGKMHISP